VRPVSGLVQLVRDKHTHTHTCAVTLQAMRGDMAARWAYRCSQIMS